MPTAVIALAVGLLAALALPAGASAAWTGPTPISTAGVAAADPQVAVDATGATTAVWTSANPPNRQIRSAFRPPGGPWEDSFTRMSSSLDCFEPELAVNAAGAAVVVADCGSGAASMNAAYRPAGGSWASAVAIPGSGSGSDPRVAIDDAGNVVVVWEGTNTVQSAYRPAAGPWAAGGQVSPAGDVADSPTVAMTPTGRAVAVWLHRLQRFAGDPVVRVESADRVGAAAWGSTPTVLSRPSTTATHPVEVAAPSIDIDSFGRRLAVWVHRQDGTIGETGPDRLTSGTGVASAWINYATTQFSTDGVRNAEQPEVATDDLGNAVATWRGFDPVGGTFRTQASYLSTSSGIWIGPVTPTTTDIGGSGEPHVAMAPGGRSMIVWRNLDSTISAVSHANGDTFQPAQTLASNGFSVPDVTMSDDGDAIATWTSQATSPVRTVIDVDDVTPPDLAAIAVPASVPAGSALNVSAAPTDTWSAPATVSWDFGDGSTASGTSATHTYSAPGARTITITATDGVGNTASATRQIEVSNGTGTGALTLGVSVPKQSWKKIRKAGGIKVRCGIDAVGRCSAAAKVSRKVAKRIGLKGSGLGSGAASIEAAGESATFVVELTRKARAAIGGAEKNVPLKLSFEGTAAGRLPAALNQKLKIKR